jgi:hypothetical protein
MQTLWTRNIDTLRANHLFICIGSQRYWQPTNDIYGIFREKEAGLFVFVQIDGMSAYTAGKIATA